MSQINSNWFPGHMKKALNNLKEIIPKCDGVINIGDSRVPLSSLSNSFDELIKNSVKINIYSKSDLTDLNRLNKILLEHKELGDKPFIVDLNNQTSREKIINCLENIRTKKDEKFLSLNFPKPNKYYVVIGIPNVGKSTLINLLSKNKKAKVENKPGLTRSEPLIKIKEKLYIYDSPGILEPNYQNKEVMLKLALIGSVKDNIFPIDQLGSFLFSHLNKTYPNLLKDKYQIDVNDYSSFFEKLAENKKMCLNNGVLDINRAISFVINELRNGKLGKICLDE